jgi:squalene-hopene/tetraprenyl-beta-curcumene cyclase
MNMQGIRARATVPWIGAAVAGLILPCWSSAEEVPPRITEYEYASAISPDEPLAERFSIERTVRLLDASATDWLVSRECIACHTMTPYLMARPAGEGILPASMDVRLFFESVADGRHAGVPDPASFPQDGVSAVAVNTAVGLALNDRQTTRQLHPATRQALDRMWTLQRADGSWEWPHRDAPPIKLNEHYGVTFAAIGVGHAPGEYAATPAAVAGLAGIRAYLSIHPPGSLHERAMLLWAARKVDGILTVEEQSSVRDELLAAQRPDGGWSLANLIENLNGAADLGQSERAAAIRLEPGFGTEFLGYAGDQNVYRSALESDGYATGFAIYVARQAGVPADDPRLARGIAWLKSHQRASGRWFTRSHGPPHSIHLISNAGTAYCLMALEACNESGSAAINSP